jgi:hypothetical protein
VILFIVALIGSTIWRVYERNENNIGDQNDRMQEQMCEEAREVGFEMPGCPPP